MALIETNFIRPQEVYDRNTGESKVRYRSYDGNNRFIPVVNGEKGVPKTMVEVTHAELKAMRDGGKLTAGAMYRITDYNCTTTQENTQSAGHQFDIVLLALSENKLAEEGWAMMHDNIYDVTFSDGVTKKCYLYFFDDDSDCNIVLAEDITKGHNLGIGSEDFPKIDKINKTAELGLSYYDDEHGDGFITIAEPNVQYNYFQNSNLSAWKVWYCLDNDKSRFAWADDRLYINDNAFGNGLLFSNPSGYTSEGWTPSSSVPDADEFKYCWANQAMIEDGDTTFMIYTKTDTPKAGDILYNPDNGTTGILDSDSFRGGRGVIYRLIDEWGNDVPWDYKNIMFTINNETTYSLSLADQQSDYEFDATLNGNTLGVIVNTTHGGNKEGKTPKSIYPISRVMLQQCLIYLNEDISLDSYLFTNNGHANIIFGLKIYDPNA